VSEKSRPKWHHVPPNLSTMLVEQHQLRVEGHGAVAAIVVYAGDDISIGVTTPKGTWSWTHGHLGDVTACKSVIEKMLGSLGTINAQGELVHAR
jgi:hypothetical protein